MATQVLVEICNKTQRPPRYLDEIKVRYYFNISEVLENNGTVDDLKVRIDYDTMKSDSNGEYQVTTEIVQYDDKGGCYVEMTWPDYKFYGSLQFQFAIMDDVQNDEYTFIWDPTNDYSRSDLKTAKELGVSLNKAPDFYDKITMYVEGQQVWGIDPQGVGPDDSPVVEPTDKVMYGDVDCNGEVNVMDAVLLARITGDDSTLKPGEVTDQSKTNSDVTHDGACTTEDLAKLMRYLANKIKLIDLSK